MTIENGGSLAGPCNRAGSALYWAGEKDTSKALPDPVRRWKFGIEWNGRHIGWVSDCDIDENDEWGGKVQEGQAMSA